MPRKGKQPYIEKGSPPSSYAVAAVLEKEPGSTGRVIMGTLMRSLFIIPGLGFSGLRGEQLVKSALLASASITGSLFGLYTLRRSGVIKSWRK